MVFKCKMCGGDIEPIKNTNTGKCIYCKSVMTLPNLDNEKIVNLYNRANDFRLSNDFDKAYGIYETILELDNKQIEAHWGLLLCKYGVEYVDDPKTGKKIPTCHRTIPLSILKDKEFEIIKKNSYGEALKLYEDEADTIAEIQKKILEISSKEEPYDIFICYKESDEKGERTNDSVIAQDIYDKLVEKGYKVFFARITLEDKLGVEYEPYIYSALTTSKVMLVVGTKEEYFNATWVKNEWARFIEMMQNNKNKSLIPVYSKIDAYKIPEEFAMYQAQSMDKVGAMQDLLRGIDKLIKVTQKNKTDDFTYEMYEKFKKMKEEEENEIKESQAANKQVEQVYETTTRSYKIITFVISLIQAILILYIVSGDSYFVKGFYYSITFQRFRMDSQYSIILITCFITLVGYFVSIVNKKSNLVSKFMYAVNIFLLFALYIIYSNLNYRVTPIFTLFVLTNVVLLIIKPKWKLSERTMYVTTEEKKEILEYNKKIKLNFTEKDKYPKYLLITMIITIAIFIVGVVYNSSIELKSQSNEINKSVQQLEIKYDYINIRQKPGANEKLLGKVYKGDIFTILGTNESSKGTWYKISTEYGVTGYIFSGENNEYITILE